MIVNEVDVYTFDLLYDIGLQTCVNSSYLIAVVCSNGVRTVYKLTVCMLNNELKIFSAC